jgi:hypothetical protein
MELPDLLREHGVSPNDFLERVKPCLLWLDTPAKRNISAYIYMAFNWSDQPENGMFWAKLHLLWGTARDKARWVELERRLEILEPLEEELLEVGDGAT